MTRQLRRQVEGGCEGQERRDEKLAALMLQLDALPSAEADEIMVAIEAFARSLSK